MVTQARAAFTSYKKGAFVKKGISASTKLKGLQSLFARSVPQHLDPKGKYLEGVVNHVQNYASHTTDPGMMITSCRVNKLDPKVVQNRPNPMALAINNNLNPNQEIGLGEKFKCVTSVSAWSLVSQPPAGYYNSGGVRWNHENMKGCIPCSAVKNLSVVPNAVSTVYEMLDADKKALNAMVKKNADVLSSACALSGFSLRKGALSFNTGVIITNDLAMACVNDRFVNSYEVEFEEEEGGKSRAEQEAAATPINRDIKGSIMSRILHSTCSACSNSRERMAAIDLAKGGDLTTYIRAVMELDPRVASQLEALVDQLENVREICNKKRKPGGAYESKLDDMVSQVKVNFGNVLREAAAKTKLHWAKCPVTVPEGGSAFTVALEAMAGKYKCTNTCDTACCQSLYFVLLTTLALNLENERRASGIPLESLVAEQVFQGDVKLAKVAVARIRTAREAGTVKTCFPKQYNQDTDSLVFLFEPFRISNAPLASMKAEDLRRSVASLGESKVTGRIWNHEDGRFFGVIRDTESMDEDTSRYGTEHELPFFTGLYHTAAVELAAACLSVLLI